MTGEPKEGRLLRMPINLTGQVYDLILSNPAIHPNIDVRETLMRASGLPTLLEVLADIRGLEPAKLDAAAVEAEKRRILEAGTSAYQLLNRVRTPGGRVEWASRPIYYQAIVEILQSGGTQETPGQS